MRAPGGLLLRSVELPRVGALAAGDTRGTLILACGDHARVAIELRTGQAIAREAALWPVHARESAAAGRRSLLIGGLASRRRARRVTRRARPGTGAARSIGAGSMP